MPTFSESVPETPEEVSIADPSRQPFPVEPGDAVVTTTVAEPVLPTQVANPGRASVRSFVQNLIGGLLLVNPVFLVIQQVMLEASDIVFPGWLWATVNGVVLGSALFATLVTRIMAIPGVNTFIEQHLSFLAPTKVRQ